VHVHGLVPGRATRDIDFGIAVASWEQFALLKERMAASGNFRADRKAMQRLIYTDPKEGFSAPVDLIPFRGVTEPDETIAWPPERDIVLNVAGFEEAMESAVVLTVEDLTVHVASLAGLTLLKLFAWFDRGIINNKDAVDLKRLIGSYCDAGNFDRLFSEELVLMEAAGFDSDLAGAELLGRDVAKICTPAALERIRTLMRPEREVERLVSQMGPLWFLEDGEVAREEQMVRKFRRGLLGPD